MTSDRRLELNPHATFSYNLQESTQIHVSMMYCDDVRRLELNLNASFWYNNIREHSSLYIDNRSRNFVINTVANKK